jgi:outer membrane biosynthesis protein TonB
VGTPGPSPRSQYLAQLKRHLKAAWRAGEVYARIDPRGKLNGSMFVSALQVRLRADGTVERADLRDTSGIHDLDMEAQAAIGRMEKMPPLPRELVDDRNGFDVRCSFHLDVGLFRFASQLHHAIAERWRPSAAFAATSEVERKTVVRLMLDRQGALVEASVVASAGVDFLDSGALEWAKPGIRFPPPPPAFGKSEGPVPIFVAFLHRAGQPRLLKPREDLEAE